jgi:ankyrin repeat protein
LNAGAHPETTRDDMPLLWMLMGAGNGGRAFVFDGERRAFCEELVQRGARIDAPGLNGRTALECCSFLGYTEAVRFLLAHGARVRSDGPFQTVPLVGAAGEARLQIVEMLLEAGADPNASQQGSGGYTPLHAVADEEASVPVARLLLEAGADPTRRWMTLSYPLKRGVTPLQIAKKRKLTELAALF